MGFRPFIYNLARSLGVTGYVQNTAKGLTVDVEGPDLRAFVDRIRSEAPALSGIESLTVEELPPCGHEEFVIRASLDRTEDFGLIPPDASVCPDCLREILDPADRRYLYPFTNCTNCGPRYSIVLGIPYDRPLTTMAKFAMCPECRREYGDPSDRRFHAQANACPDCGPQVQWVQAVAPLSPQERANLDPLSLWERAGVRGREALSLTIRALREGKIVAVKGLGGFHLACDATNGRAVARLREGKRKSNKPFALMAGDLESIEAFCRVSPDDAGMLTGRERPIVLLPRREDGDPKRARGGPVIDEAVAPGNRDLGFMLPYTPLHYLLFYLPAEGRNGERAEPNFPALVMTSGNLAEEPIVIENGKALEKLGGIADCFLLHDRDIYMRVDDSIVRRGAGATRLLRRSRGWAPEAIRLGMGFLSRPDLPEILACGADLKNTFCLTKGGYAILSQHIGDLENPEAVAFFEETLANLKLSFRVEPTVVAHDLHPDYLSAKPALSFPADRKIPVQHHHAHVAACMAEQGLEGEVIGVAFDGAGYGPDGAVWGGEFLVADYRSFRREAHFKYVPLPGGDQAVREPWRMAASYLAASGCLEKAGYSEAEALSAALGGRIDQEALGVVLRMIRRGINSPLTSSVGRLFDAVAGLLGIADRVTFEGEAAIALEHAADAACDEVYSYAIVDGADYPAVDTEIIDFAPAIRSIVEDRGLGAAPGVISAKFHNTLAAAVDEMCRRIRGRTGWGRVVLSGGVFQNRILLERCLERLRKSGFEVYAHQRVPTNDGGISLGQAVIAAARGPKKRR